MMEKIRNSKKIRPLTKSEKFLLTTLGLIILLWGSFRFLITPQEDKILALQNEKLDLDTKIMDMNNTLKKEEKIKKEWEVLHVERDQILSHYFPILDQSQIIYLLNNLLADDRVNVADYNFNRPSSEKIGEMEVRQIGISIPFIGNYDGVVDIVKSLGTSPRRILVDSLSLDRKDDKELSGNMSLKIYSLEGLAETDPNVIEVATVDSPTEGSLFRSFKDYKEESFEGGFGGASGNGTSSSNDGTELIKAQILHDFENLNYNFIPSNELVKGDVTPSTIRKSGKYSLRFEYNILALEDENRAYIDLSSSDIILKYPPDTVSMWVNSFGYSPGTLGMRLRTQSGDDIDVKIVEGISWIGWSNLQTSVPMDLKLYPLQLTHLYYELPFNRDDFGVLLLDKLEAFYPYNEDESVINKLTNEFYVVQPGETISSISRKIYGTNKYKNEIMENNGIKAGDILPVGKVLVLVKR